MDVSNETTKLAAVGNALVRVNPDSHIRGAADTMMVSNSQALV